MKMVRHLVPAAWGMMALAGTRAQALPLANGMDFVKAPLAATMADSDVDFTAIVALNNCSGSLVRFTTSQPADQAMVLTNGHCFEGGFINQGTAVVNKASSRTFRLLKSDASSTLATLRATNVIYATMTGTDITLYRLSSTYADIESQYHVQALTISDVHPEAATPIRVVSGYWKKIYACNIESFVPQLHEDQWTFTDSIRYSRPGCETIGGTSGSPIIHAETKEVIGINNTSNENGERCTLDNPCEVDAQGNVTYTKGVSYGQELYIIYDCLTSDNQLDLTREGCTLTK